MSISQTDVSAILENNLQNIQENITTEYVKADTTTRCHFIVAPSWGNLSKDSIKMMDDFLKTSLFVTFNTIDKFVQENGQAVLTWDKLLEIMEQNLTVERKHTEDINILTSQQRSEFNFAQDTIDRVLSDHINRWIHETVQNKELIKIIGEANIQKISDIFASNRCKTVDSFEHFFSADETESFTLMDVGIIRIPDITNPVIQLFRIKLYVVRIDSRVLFVQKDDSQLVIEVNTRDYVPRKEVISQVKQSVMDRAIQDINKLLEKAFLN